MAEADARYVRNPDYIFRRVVDELVLVPIHQDVADMDCIYTLNEVGAFVWEHLEQPARLEELSASVLTEFEVDLESTMADLQQFLNELTEFGAVTRS